MARLISIPAMFVAMLAFASCTEASEGEFHHALTGEACSPQTDTLRSVGDGALCGDPTAACQCDAKQFCTRIDTSETTFVDVPGTTGTQAGGGIVVEPGLPGKPVRPIESTTPITDDMRANGGCDLSVGTSGSDTLRARTSGTRK